MSELASRRSDDVHDSAGLSGKRLYYRQFVWPDDRPIRYLARRHEPRPDLEYRTVHPRRPHERRDRSPAAPSPVCP